MIFKVNNINFIDNVQESTYKIDEQDVYSEWKDANGIKHRNVTRKQISGSFEMVFVEGLHHTYDEFLSALNAATTDGVLKAQITVTNKNVDKSIDCFYSIKFKTIRRITDTRTFRKCTFTLEEC